MKVNIRLYEIHDFDLILLSQTKYLDFSQCAKSAIQAYARNEAYEITVPTNAYVDNDTRSKRITFTLKADEDADVIKVLDGIPLGIKNAIMKNIIRQSIKGNYIDFILKNISNNSDLIHRAPKKEKTEVNHSVKSNARSTDNMSEITSTFTEGDDMSEITTASTESKAVVMSNKNTVENAPSHTVANNDSGESSFDMFAGMIGEY